jgi:hypothetical protein
MKKQLIAAAVATSISAIAFADVSITGNANYEYFSKDANGIKTNDADTEVNLSVKGKSGDTGVVVNFEIDSSGDNSSAGEIDVEDVYMTTKIGDFNIKAGDFASGTTALIGEIDNGGRAINKLDINTTVGGVKVGYAVNSGKDTASATSDYSVYDTDSSAVYASGEVSGITLQVKEQTDSYTAMGAKGSVAGVDFRIEQKDSDTATSDVLFYEVGTKLGALNVSYAAIDADAAGLVTEDDSSIFAREMASSGTGLSNVDGVNQITVSTVMDGTTLTAKLGELTGTAGYQDAAFSQLGAKRKLASGATINVTYDDYEATGKLASATMTDTQVLEVDLSIAF